MNGTTITATNDRQLLAELSRWRKANGWTRDWRGVLVNPDRTLGVDICDGSDGMGAGFRLMRGDLLHKPTYYPADSVRQAVDLLVALDILPVQFSSAYGVEAVIADREAQASSPEVAAAVAFTLEMELRPWFGPRSIPEEHLRRIAARLVGSAQWIRPAAPGCDCSATGGQGLVPTASREHADDCPAVTR